MGSAHLGDRDGIPHVNAMVTYNRLAPPLNILRLHSNFAHVVFSSPHSISLRAVKKSDFHFLLAPYPNPTHERRQRDTLVISRGHSTRAVPR